MRVAILVPDGIVSMTGGAADRLWKQGDGDAALLYLYILRTGALPKGGWPEERLLAARETLYRLKLVTREAAEAPLAPPPQESEEPPEYTTEDLKRELESDKTFPHLVDEVERRLGRKLNSADLKMLLTVYDHLALPAEVVLMLVNWCVEDYERKYGVGRRPRMSQIRKEAFTWHRLGVDTAEEADRYVRKRTAMTKRQAELFRLMDMPQRPPVGKEESYLEAWDSMGFEDEAIRLAYEKTVLRKQGMNWAYMNSILRSWHEKGLHTAAAIETGDRSSTRRSAGQAGMAGGQPPRPEQDERARASMEKLRRKLWQEKEEVSPDGV